MMQGVLINKLTVFKILPSFKAAWYWFQDFIVDFFEYLSYYLIAFMIVEILN